MVTSNVLVLSTCAICKDDDNENGASIVVTTCGHAFHSACMNDAEKHGMARRCPFCNVTLSNEYGGYYDGYSSTTKFYHRLHSVNLRQAILIEDGEPSPEEELKTIRTNLDSVKVLLNSKSDQAKKLEADLATLRSENEALQTTIPKLKTESKQQSHKISSILGELKAEKHNRSKGVAIHLGEKEKLQKRIDEGSAYIDKLKAERSETHKFIYALRGDNSKYRGLSDRQAQTIKELQSQIADLNREKNRLQLLISSMKQNSTNPNRGSANITQTALHDLSGGFHKLEFEYLALKRLFTRKLEEISKPQLNSNPLIHGIPINPVLLEPMESWQNTNNISSNLLKIDPVVANPPENGSGRSRRKRNKGKQRAGFDNVTKDEPRASTKVKKSQREQSNKTPDPKKANEKSANLEPMEDPKIVPSQNNESEGSTKPIISTTSVHVQTPSAEVNPAKINPPQVQEDTDGFLVQDMHDLHSSGSLFSIDAQLFA